MPLVEVTLTEGRTAEQIRALIHEVTAAVERSVAAPRANIRVVVREVPTTHFAAGDVTIAERHEQDRLHQIPNPPADSKRDDA